jgi:ferredoxin
MAKRKIIEINEDLCNGCGQCIPNCPEGALQVIDGKARLVSDLFCDGLGACIGHCPTGAMKVVQRDAEAYDERKVMKNIVKAGKNTIIAHLKHLKDHGETKFLNEAIAYLKDKKVKNPLDEEEKMNKKSEHTHAAGFQGCPGAKMMNFEDETDVSSKSESGQRDSKLKQWPVQLHLVSPNAPYYNGKDVVLAADCVAYALADFHKDYLSGKSLAIACPKLDSDQEVYVEKITSMIDNAKINSLTVMIMEVPCCSGLLGIAKEAASKAKRKVPIKTITVGIKGAVLSEEWI